MTLEQTNLEYEYFRTVSTSSNNLSGIPLSKTNAEDVDTKAEDHAYDALRYMLMTRMTGYVSIHKTLGGIKSQGLSDARPNIWDIK